MDIARKTALSSLDKIIGEGSYSNLTLQNTLSSDGLTLLDKSFASALVYGVLDRKITLDYVLNKYLKRGINKTSLTTANALRMALYQIMFMDKVPDSAAVNESVNLIKKSKERYNASLVNGVLRNILRNGIEIPGGNTMSDISVKYSCEEYIVKSLVKDYGLESTKLFLEESLKIPPVYIRVNNIKIDCKKLKELLLTNNINVVDGNTENSLIIKDGFDLSKLDLFKQGLFHIEDEACQRAIKFLELKSGLRVLDMCAAPGGKTFSMAEEMGNKGEIIACDIYKSRVDLINSGAKRLGLSIINGLVSDASQLSDLGKFDAILCDVPCSGFGVIRRKPEIKYKKQESFTELESIQKNILFNADNYLKDGGKILYSTCTLRKGENEKQVEVFLKEHKNYKLLKEYTFLPFKDGTDGFYCALLQKSW